MTEYTIRDLRLKGYKGLRSYVKQKVKPVEHRLFGKVGLGVYDLDKTINDFKEKLKIYEGTHIHDRWHETWKRYIRELESLRTEPEAA